MSRLFYALWPDPEIRSKLSDLSEAISHGRAIAPQNLHITLVFLGQVDEDIRRSLIPMTDDIRIERFQIQLSKCGWWKRAGIFWLSPDQIPQQLFKLSARLTDIAKHCNLSIEDRPYRPHVSLARKITSPLELDFQPISWEVREFCLLESKPMPRGVEYKIIHTWPLT